MKSVAIFTSTRADFGLLSPLIKRLIDDSFFDVRIFVAGTHFDKKFGYTVKEIQKGFSKNIYYKVQQNMQESSRYKNLEIMSLSISQYTKALKKSIPDMAIILGDRYEALCFALVCHSFQVPIAHIHGGELSYGALDEQYRHCITKLSTLHFTACEAYRRRVVQMGENPKLTFNVGALGVENALKHPLLTRRRLEVDLGVSLDKEIYLLTFHPETHSKDYGVEILVTFLGNLKKYIIKNKALVIVTGVNSDPGAQQIRRVLKEFYKDVGAQNCLMVESLGITRYLSLMRLATAVLGNSSSGILEAYSLKTPTVNIGSRQAGREREESVIDLKTVSDCKKFRFSSLAQKKRNLEKAQVSSIFGRGDTSKKISKHIKAYIKKSGWSEGKLFWDTEWL